MQLGIYTRRVTGALGRSGVRLESTWLQLMCCALSISGSSYFGLGGRVELRQRSRWRVGLQQGQELKIRGLRLEAEVEVEAEVEHYHEGVKNSQREV
jgi:hypothetical protein